MAAKGYYTRKMKELRASRGNCCEECSKTGTLEFAHVALTPLCGANGNKGKGRGMPQRYHDIKKHPECYKLLCPECHSKIDKFRRLPKEPPF